MSKDDDGMVRRESREARLRRAQKLAAPYLQKKGGSSEAFIAERRREAARESKGGRVGTPPAKQRRS